LPATTPPLPHQRDAEIDEALMEALERWTSLSA
jgi:hypothetical protein